MSKNYFVTAIGTGVGKTVISAVLCEAFGLDYWKPIQAGSLDNTDSQVVSKLVTNPDVKIHHEKYRLETPCSPHLAADLDGLEMQLSDFITPETKNGLIIEGAGGLLVPLNKDTTVLDLINHMKAPVIVISKNYLGSINHTLLTLDKLLTSKTEIRGIVFNGEENRESEKIIKSMTGVRTICHVNLLEKVTKDTIREEALRIKEEINELN